MHFGSPSSHRRPFPREAKFNSPANFVLVFPCGGQEIESRYDFAFLDEDGKVGQSGDELFTGRAGDLLCAPVVLPRLTSEVSLAAWEKGGPGQLTDFSKPPTAKMVFPNPLLAKPDSVPMWEDGKQQVVQEWRGITITLNKATRTASKAAGAARTSFDFKLTREKSSEDLVKVDWYIEDNRRNFYHPDGGGGWSSGEGMFSFSTVNEALWAENLNWRLSLRVFPANTATMLANEHRRIRIDLSDVSNLAPQVIAPVMDLNGTIIRNLRVARDPRPAGFWKKENFDQWYVPALIEFEVEKSAPATVIQFLNFYDGVLPFEQRRRWLSTASESSDHRTMTSQIALDKSADFLEIYFQPELEE